MADFVWGAGGEPVATSAVSSRRRLAEALMAQGADISPIRSPWQGLARVAQALVGGYESGQEDQKEKAATDLVLNSPALAAGGGGSSPMPAAMGSVPAVAGAARMPGTATDTSEKIYSNDEPSPLDPPSGADRDMAIRTIVAEAGNQPFNGQVGVASTFRNRAVDGSYGGDTIPGVIQKPYAYEPWNTSGGRGQMAAMDPNSPQYATAGRALDAAYFGNDPTDGATHFVAPKAQAALGRPMPSWATGEGTTIGDHVFYSPDDGRAAAIPANAQAAQGFAVPGQPQAAANVQSPAAPQIPPATADYIRKLIANPYTRNSGIQLLAQYSKPRETYSQATDAQGNIWNVNNLNGQRAVALKAHEDSTPSSVLEYNYYKQNFQPTAQQQQPMDYATFSTAKARAGAAVVNNNMGGGSDKQIFDTFAENTKEARSAATGLVALRNARTALQGDGGNVTGFRANERLSLQKAGAYLGITDPSAIQNTETFRAAIAPQVAATLKATVGTNQISNSDREFAEKAAGGAITLDQGSINRLLNIMEKAGIARLQLHQEQLDAVYPDPVANRRERALFGINVPTSEAPPAGATKSGIKWSVE